MIYLDMVLHAAEPSAVLHCELCAAFLMHVSGLGEFKSTCYLQSPQFHTVQPVCNYKLPVLLVVGERCVRKCLMTKVHFGRYLIQFSSPYSSSRASAVIGPASGRS